MIAKMDIFVIRYKINAPINALKDITLTKNKIVNLFNCIYINSY